METATHLLLDCSFAGVTLAVARPQGAGLTVLAGKTTAEARSSDALAPFLKAVLKESGTPATALTHAVVTVGPGSFTGCRLGLAVADALQLVTPSLQVSGLSTLGVLAHQVLAENPQLHPLVVLLDAAGGQVYSQLFGAQGQPLSPAVCQPVAEALASARAAGAHLAAQASLMLGVPHMPLTGITPGALAACAAQPGLHVPPQPVYIKALTYRKVAETIAYTSVTPVVEAFAGGWSNPLLSHAEACALLAAGSHVLVWHASGAHGLASCPGGAMGDVITLFTPVSGRRQGHARQVLSGLKAFAHQGGSTGLALEVRESNTAALAAYAQAGFARVGTRKGYYAAPPEDAAVLTVTF